MQCSVDRGDPGKDVYPPLELRTDAGVLPGMNHLADQERGGGPGEEASSI